MKGTLQRRGEIEWNREREYSNEGGTNETKYVWAKGRRIHNPHFTNCKFYAKIQIEDLLEKSANSPNKNLEISDLLFLQRNFTLETGELFTSVACGQYEFNKESLRRHHKPPPILQQESSKNAGVFINEKENSNKKIHGQECHIKYMKRE